MLISEISDFDQDDDVVQYVIDAFIDRTATFNRDRIHIQSDDYRVYPDIVFRFFPGGYVGRFMVTADKKPTITIIIPGLMGVDCARYRNRAANLVIRFLKEYGSVLIHEYSHFLDWKRTGKVDDTAAHTAANEFGLYYNSDAEFAAYFREGMHRFKGILVDIHDKHKKDPFLAGVNKLFNLAVACISKEFIEHLSEDKKIELYDKILDYIESQRDAIKPKGVGRIGSIVPRR